MWFKNITSYLGKAVQSDTGVSSLSLIIVSISVMATITMIVICVCILFEMFKNYTIASSLEGYAAIISAVATLVAAVGVPKAINNYGESKFRHQHKDELEDEDND